MRRALGNLTIAQLLQARRTGRSTELVAAGKDLIDNAILESSNQVLLHTKQGFFLYTLILCFNFLSVYDRMPIQEPFSGN